MKTMNFSILIILLSTIITCWISTLNAQCNDQSLSGVWYLESKTNNSPFSLDIEDISIELPGRSPRDSMPKKEPFQERWAFDSQYTYIHQMSTMIQATTYHFDSTQLILNFSTPQKYDLISCFEDSLVLALERNELFGSFIDTLYFKKENESLTDFKKYQHYVHQQTLDGLQLHGVYEHILDHENIEGLSEILNEGELASLIIRVYPDSTLLFGFSQFPKEAIGWDRCRDCNKFDVMFLPYPFGLHTLSKEEEVFYFQPSTYLTLKDQIAQHQPIKKEDQIRFDIFFREGNLYLKGKNILGLKNDEQLFTFIPFSNMNYVLVDE